jgi:hypothetical protein
MWPERLRWQGLGVSHLSFANFENVVISADEL